MIDPPLKAYKVKTTEKSQWNKSRLSDASELSEKKLDFSLEQHKILRPSESQNLISTKTHSLKQSK